MSTTVAINAAMTSAAISAASQARMSECRAILATFDNQGSTREQKTQYASCVREIYPSQTTPNELLAMKIGVSLLFIALAVGAVKGWREDGFMGAVGDGFMAVTIVFLAIIFLALVAIGIVILFS